MSGWDKETRTYNLNSSVIDMHNQFVMFFMINYCLSVPECPHQYFSLSFACQYLISILLQNRSEKSKHGHCSIIISINDQYQYYLNLSIILKLTSTDPILRYVEEASLYRVSTQWPPTNSRVFWGINCRLSFACFELTEVCLVVLQCH